MAQILAIFILGKESVPYINLFFHVRRGCLGAQPRHMVGAVYHGVGDSWGCSFPSPMGANASRGWSGSRGRIA